MTVLSELDAYELLEDYPDEAIIKLVKFFKFYFSARA